MSTVLFKRGTTSDMDDTTITDGLLYFNTETYKIYMDNGTERLQYGGDTDLISSTSDALATNTFSATAEINLFPLKTTVVDTMSNALAVTSHYIPLGCLAFSEALGTTDFSDVGDGTISGGLTALRGETLESTLASGSTSLTLTSTILTSTSYIDVYTDVYGVNPTAITTDTNAMTITLTFKAQSSSVVVRVVVRNM